jgi:hypothetical protein
MTEATPHRIEDEDAERLALEVAISEARLDPRPAIPHETVREQLLKDADRARKKIATLADRRLAS